MRCLPHDMNTGGFFIALFRKTAPIGVRARKKENMAGVKEAQDVMNTEDESETCAKGDLLAASPEEGTDLISLKGNTLLRGRGATRGDSGNSDFIPVSSSLFPELSKFYGFTDDFPSDQIMARVCGEAKVLHFITKCVKEKLIDRGIQRTTVINSGLKVFERNNKECEARYRISQEGVHMIVPFMKKRKVVVNFGDFLTCLKSGAIHLDQFSEKTRAEIKSLSVGSFAAVLEGYERDAGKKMVLVMWRCRADAVNCLVAKVEIDGMKSKLRAIAKLNNIRHKLDE